MGRLIDTGPNTWLTLCSWSQQSQAWPPHTPPHTFLLLSIRSHPSQVLSFTHPHPCHDSTGPSPSIPPSPSFLVLQCMLHIEMRLPQESRSNPAPFLLSPLQGLLPALGIGSKVCQQAGQLCTPSPAHVPQSFPFSSFCLSSAPSPQYSFPLHMNNTHSSCTHFSAHCSCPGECVLT